MRIVNLFCAVAAVVQVAANNVETDVGSNASTSESGFSGLLPERLRGIFGIVYPSTKNEEVGKLTFPEVAPEFQRYLPYVPQESAFSACALLSGQPGHTKMWEKDCVKDRSKQCSQGTFKDEKKKANECKNKVTEECADFSDTVSHRVGKTCYNQIRSFTVSMESAISTARDRIFALFAATVVAVACPLFSCCCRRVKQID